MGGIGVVDRGEDALFLEQAGIIQALGPGELPCRFGELIAGFEGQCLAKSTVRRNLAQRNDFFLSDNSDPTLPALVAKLNNMHALFLPLPPAARLLYQR